jgi:hypothetical protein
MDFEGWEREGGDSPSAKHRNTHHMHKHTICHKQGDDPCRQQPDPHDQVGEHAQPRHADRGLDDRGSVAAPSPKPDEQVDHREDEREADEDYAGDVEAEDTVDLLLTLV